MSSSIYKSVIPRLIVYLTLQVFSILHCTGSISLILETPFYGYMYAAIVLGTGILAFCFQHRYWKLESATMKRVFVAMDIFIAALNVGVNLYCYDLLSVQEITTNWKHYWSGLALVFLITVLFELLNKIILSVKKDDAV